MFVQQGGQRRVVADKSGVDVTVTRQLGPLTRAVNSGSGNRALLSRAVHNDVYRLYNVTVSKQYACFLIVENHGSRNFRQMQ